MYGIFGMTESERTRLEAGFRNLGEAILTLVT